MDARITQAAAPRRPLRSEPGGWEPRQHPAVTHALGAAALTFVLVLGAGLGAYLAFGVVAHRGFDPAGIVGHLGGGRDALAAPFARWDSVWYLTIARRGYLPGPDVAFFPLYPLLVALVGALGPGLLAGGVLVSVACLPIGLYLLWRLTELELGQGYPDAPALTVLATALGPMAFFFTAVYSESLYLALSLGAFFAARRGRWAWAGALGGLAAATRSQGLLLLGALGLLYLEQRRGMAPHPRPGRGQGRAAPPGSAPAPPRPRRRDALWLLGVPAGLLAYLGWLGLRGLDPLAPFTAQQAWFRHFTGPLGGLEQGVRAAVGGALQLLSGQTRIHYFPAAGGDPTIAAGHNLMLLGFLFAALILLLGALRRLPLAYGGYATAAILVAISYPVAPQPLASLPRFLVVLFPLQMVVGLWLARHPRLRLPALTASATALAVFAGLFATWHWVA